MKKLYTLAKIKETAIAMDHPMVIRCDHLNYEDLVNPLEEEKLILLENTYDVDSGILSFVHNKVQYVIPRLDGIEDVLKAADFRKESHPIPFGRNWSYPVEFKKHWEELREFARKQIA